MYLHAIDGLKIAYETWNEAAPGPWVILHHGFGVDGQINWVRPGIVAALTKAGRKVAAIDARGHGKSDKPHDQAFYGEARMAGDVLSLIDQLGAGAVDLVGYSMGAVVSLIVAAKDPRIHRLVVGGVGEGVIEHGGVDASAVSGQAIRAALLADDLSMVLDPAARPFRQMADATGADRLALAAQAAVVHAEPIALSRICAPTLVLAGDADPLAVNPHRLAAAIPQAKVELAPGDHRSVVGHPGFAKAITSFLAPAPL